MATLIAVGAAVVLVGAPGQRCGNTPSFAVTARC